MRSVPTQQKTWIIKCSILYMLCFFMNGIQYPYLGASIPIKAKLSHLQETDYSIVFTARGIGFIIGALVVSRIETKIGSHKAIALSLSVMALMLFMNHGEISIFWNAMEWFIVGIFHCVISILAQVQLMTLQKQNVSVWLQSMHFGFGVAASCSPVLLSVLGTKVLFYYAIYAIVLALIIFRQKSPSQVIQKTTEPTVEQQNIISQNQQKVYQLCKLLGIFLLFYVGFEGTYGGWIPTYSAIQGVTTQQNAGLSASLFWISITFGRLISIPIAAKYPPHLHLKALILSGIVVSIFCLTFLMFQMKSFVVFVGSVLFGLVCSSMYPLCVSLPVAFKYRLSSSNTALMTLISSGGDTIVLLVIGYLMKFFGASMLYFCTFCFTVILYFLYGRILRYRPKQCQMERQISSKFLDGYRLT